MYYILDLQITESCRPKLQVSECKVQVSFSSSETFKCYHLPQLNAQNLNESCVQGDSFNYFARSEASFIFTFIGIGTFLIGNC